jgi:hypothetical protein
MNIRIIINFKYKHTRFDFTHKKDKVTLNVDLRRFSQPSQNLEDVKGFTLKQLEVTEHYFHSQKSKAITAEINTLKDLLKKTKACIPEFSLL